ncbi:hypothetical protein HAX54_028536 [Datura stramonium]|uniref:Uncharacterized protein n=1 Tax=Datura stramonium TaxID=4076 RepID=A0ABS8V4A4_DATST|nr:hypothetical protein [Datura stramonium]
MGEVLVGIALGGETLAGPLACNSITIFLVSSKSAQRRITTVWPDPISSYVTLASMESSLERNMFWVTRRESFSDCKAFLTAIDIKVGISYINLAYCLSSLSNRAFMLAKFSQMSRNVTPRALDMEVLLLGPIGKG